jgi:hypothetical protein
MARSARASLYRHSSFEVLSLCEITKVRVSGSRFAKSGQWTSPPKKLCAWRISNKPKIAPSIIDPEGGGFEAKGPQTPGGMGVLVMDVENGPSKSGTTATVQPDKLLLKYPAKSFASRSASPSFSTNLMTSFCPLYAFNAAHVIEDDVAYVLFLYAGFGIEVSAFFCGVTLVWRIVIGWFSAANSN